MKRAGVLRIAGAHDALSARLVEHAGFDGVWASGYAISAALECVPDASFVDSSEQLEVERRMVDAVDIPVIADCSTGYGNALNVMRTIRDRENAGVAAVCLEDSVFPKRCSYYDGVRRALVTIDEHCGKIRAAKAAQREPDFVVIARTEALIVGEGLEEALRRAESYAGAGADAVLVHSRSSSFDELRSVAAGWSGRVPLVAIPTAADQTPASEMEQCGFKIIVYANQVLRAAVKAMRDTLDIIASDSRPGAANDLIATMAEVDEIVGVKQVERNEKEFLPRD